MTVKLEDAKLNRDEKIVRIGKLNPIFCKDTDSILSVAQRIITVNHRRIPIISKKDTLIGIITYMDILDALLRNQDKNSSISSIMTRDIIFCNFDDTIGFVLQKLKMSRRGGLPIKENDRVIGMVSERDFVKHFDVVKFNMKTEEVMTPKPFYITKKFSVINCLKSMVNTHYRRLPVVENSTLIGIVTAIDILKFLGEYGYDLKSLDVGIEKILKPNVYTITGDKDVSESLKLMKEKDVGGVLVVNERNELKGLITERDILEEIV